MSGLDPWQLPRAAVLDGVPYALHTDYRDVLTVIAWLTGTAAPDLNEQQRWYIAMRLFYPDFAAMPRSVWNAAAQYLADFLAGGRSQPAEAARPGPRLLDWQQDAPLIAAGVSGVAGQDVRALPYLHWWSFLACFEAMGEGPFATIVALRDKLRRGKKLEKWELDFYKTHRAQVDLRPLAPADPAAEAAARAEKQRLLAMLG